MHASRERDVLFAASRKVSAICLRASVRIYLFIYLLLHTKHAVDGGAVNRHPQRAGKPAAARVGSLRRCPHRTYLWMESAEVVQLG